MSVYDVRLVDKDKRTDAEKSKDNSPDSEIVLGVRATPHDVVQTSHQPVASHAKDDLGKLIWTAADQSEKASLDLLLGECKSRKNTASLMYADAKGRTPLHQAVQGKSIQTIKALLEAGANVVCADMESRTPLHEAVQSKSLEIVKVLLDADANVVYVDMDGRTPLHEAVQSKSLDTVKVLLEAGAVVMKLDKGGKVRCSLFSIVIAFVLQRLARLGPMLLHRPHVAITLADAPAFADAHRPLRGPA